MTDLYAITNPGFENSATGWTLPASASVVNYQTETGEPAPEGVHALKFTGTSGLTSITGTKVKVGVGKSITASAMYQQGAASAGRNAGYIVLSWYDAVGNKIGEATGNVVSSGRGGRWHRSAVTAVSPANVDKVEIGFRVMRDSGNTSYVDSFQWNHSFNGEVVLTYPQNGSTYLEGSTVPFRVSITAPDTNLPTKVEYFDGATLLGTVEASPFAFNSDSLADGIHDISAKVTFADGSVITTSTNVVTITDVPIPPPPRREFKASNAHSYMLAGEFQGLASAIPSVSLITGAELVLTCAVDVLTRNKDRDVPADQSAADLAFSMLQGGTLEFVLLRREDDGTYTKVGSPASTTLQLDRADYQRTETGISDGMRWSVYKQSTTQDVTSGDTASVFGLESLAATDFLNMYVGMRFYANKGAIPATTEFGDACLRLLVDAFKLRVYFNSGSVKYYFLTPDEDVVEGSLISSYVLDGDLKNGDGAGVMQLGEELVLKDGTGIFLTEGTTVHSAYPPTDDNRVATLTADMKYNGMPSSYQLRDSRTRAQIITANFYGDERLNSMYGVTGCDRAFAYDGNNFYKIYTQPDADKDMPRHVAYHHAHLALGYREGRVDVSVAGEPYNFNGVDGASSWGIGDSVTGLLPLSGSILGIFCAGSVVGMSGTTVDNFATQTISAKMGAVEYTIADMGYPVYANAYGVYTLSQVQQYGDYLGTPLSQEISPWLRKRLVRKDNAAVEVVTAWPVRSKNQYRLAFSDGYVMTMTMNNGQQAAPTFSLQRYLLPETAGTSYDGAAIVPAAVSSELDSGGEERIHIAHAYAPEPPDSPPPPQCTTMSGDDVWGGSGTNYSIYTDYITNAPDWLNEIDSFFIDFFDDGTPVMYERTYPGTFELVNLDDQIYGEQGGRGTMFFGDGNGMTCVNWYIPAGV